MALVVEVMLGYDLGAVGRAEEIACLQSREYLAERQKH
jgi:hypothetical protein